MLLKIHKTPYPKIPDSTWICMNQHGSLFLAHFFIQLKPQASNLRPSEMIKMDLEFSKIYLDGYDGPLKNIILIDRL